MVTIADLKGSPALKWYKGLDSVQRGAAQRWATCVLIGRCEKEGDCDGQRVGVRCGHYRLGARQREARC